MSFRLPLSAPERGPGGEVNPASVVARWDGEVNPAPIAARQEGEVNPVAARLLAEVLALDLGNLTPIRALTLLHELQTKAREAVPWSSWMASMAGARDQTENQKP
jgi:hypothetical protein